MFLYASPGASLGACFFDAAVTEKRDELNITSRQAFTSRERFRTKLTTSLHLVYTGGGVVVLD